MAPLPVLSQATSSPIDSQSSEIPIYIDTTRLSHTISSFFNTYITTKSLSLQLFNLAKRDLGPSQSQSVGMAVGLSIAGVVVAIFIFGWVRYLAAREHHREAARRKAAEAQAADEKGGSEGGDAPAEEAPAEE